MKKGELLPRSSSMLEITQKARDMLGQFAEQAENGGNLSLKVEIVGRGPKGFQYDLQLIGSEDAQDDDIEVSTLTNPSETDGG